MYNHGIRVQEKETSLATPVNGTAGLQVVFGTAPINTAADPYGAVNSLFIVYNFAEAKNALGYSDDFSNYSLCQSMDANFRVFNIAPIILCNVLDPVKHKRENLAATYPVLSGQCVVEIQGILLNTLKIKFGAQELTLDTDYISNFNDSGNVVITLLKTGQAADATEISVSSQSIDPTQVTANDIIGGYDVATGKETGMELIRQVYPKFGLTPGLILAPGWSQNTSVAAVMASKSIEINGVFSCENLVDLDTTKAKIYTDCEKIKKESGLSSSHTIVLWPRVRVGDKEYAYSAIYGAMVAYTDAQNGDIPSTSPSNKALGISKTVLEDGTEIILDQVQANIVNSAGIVTMINDSGWKSWGNNTACYPGVDDPKDRWISCRRVFTWWGNSFILTYSKNVDDPANYRLIESIVDSENIRGNSYVSQGKFAGVRMEFNEEDNKVESIIGGKLQFKQYLAPYTPAEDILNVLEFDPDMIQTAIGGE